jgi:pimeloyl-ACP methyl ester carboxylesterase
MLADWPEPDARFFSNPAWLKLMYTSMAEAFRQGDDGVKAVFQEHNLFMHSWSAPITQIPPGKLLIWHGSQDKTCPTENAYKIAHCIKGAHLEVFPEEGHCVMFSKLEKLCKALNQET